MVGAGKNLKPFHFSSVFFLKICFEFIVMVFAGMDDANSPFISIKDALKDNKRVKYHNDYLESLLASIKYVTS